MTEAENIWRGKTDSQILIAVTSLDEYTEEGRRVILAEAARRGLNVAPLAHAVASLPTDGPAQARRCAYCNTRILFGGKREGALQFCNEDCRQRGILLTVSNQIPSQVVADRVRAVFHGACPACGGAGPVDVHTSHRVVSALVVTSSRNRPALTCKRCGVRTKVRDTAVSLALGWWGVPWGVVMTPVQVGRNLAGLFDRTDASQPSARLETLVRLQLASELIAQPPPDSLTST